MNTLAADEIRRFLWKSTLSNYALIGLKLLSVLIITRLIFLGLSREAYGFWALLWSIFGYSLLLDFGFGTALQKSTSETLETQNWTAYNQTISTAFFIYTLMGLVLAILTLIITPFLPYWFHFSSQESIPSYQQIFLLFGLGTALVFPTGFFTEVLRGLQAIQERNLIQMGSQLLQLLLLWAVLNWGGGLMSLTLVSLGINLVTNLTLAFYAKRLIPSLKIRWRDFQPKQVKSLVSFSFFAYLITLTNLIIFRTDQLIISTCLSVSLVAGYQIASRLADMFRQLATQLHDALGPLAARCFISDQTHQLRQTLLQSNRIVTLIALGFFLPLFFHLQPLLKIWLGLEDPEVITTAYILLISMLGLVCLRSTTTQILLMCQKERVLMKIALVESFANLVLSIYLALTWDLGIVGVALGTLLPNLLLSLGVQIPLACRFAEVSLAYYFRITSLRAGMILALMLFIYPPIFAHWQVQSGPELLFSLLLCSGMTLLLIFFLGLGASERQILWQNLPWKKQAIRILTWPKKKLRVG